MLENCVAWKALDLLPDPLFILSSDGTILAANAPAKRLFALNAPPIHLSKFPSVDTKLLQRSLLLWKRNGTLIRGPLSVLDKKGDSYGCYGCRLAVDGSEVKIMLRMKAKSETNMRFVELTRRAAGLSRELYLRKKEAQIANQRFGEAFKSAAQGMALVSLNGRWIDVNDATTKLFGYSREELLATDFQTLTHPEDLESDLTLLQDLLTGRIDQYQMKKRYYRRDGTIMYALLSVGLVSDEDQRPLHFVSQIQDVSTEHHALQEIETNRSFLGQLFNSLTDAVLVLDADTRIVDHNWAATKLLELPSDATGSPLGTRLHELTARLSENGTKRKDKSDAAKLLARWNTTLAIADKEPLPLELTLTPVRGAAEPALRWVLVVRDLSESQRNEMLKNQFVATVSHELRTPLTSISGSLGLITGGVLGELPEQMENMLRIAQQNTQRLIQLVNDLLDLNKLSAEEMEFSIQHVDIATILGHAIEQMKSYAEPYHVRLKITGDTSGHIKVDPDRLLQVLHNLISNACKYSPQGETVDIHCEPDAEDGARISVVDRGPGIPEAFRSRIFERFAQAEASDNRAKGGTGLGLAITKELVERMGGVIGFESREDEGTRFWFRFPRAEVH